MSAQSRKPASGATAQGISDSAASIARFIRDQDKGLASIYANLRARVR